jgi:hypothetical protein
VVPAACALTEEGRAGQVRARTRSTHAVRPRGIVSLSMIAAALFESQRASSIKPVAGQASAANARSSGFYS